MAQNYDDNAPAWGNRTDSDVAKIKNNFEALKSTFSGASQPPNPVAGMWWYDTTAHILKVRNEANNAWLSVWDLANNKPVIANLSNEITGAMINSSLKSPAAGVEGLRKLGTGALDAMPGNTPLVPPDGSVSMAKLANAVGGTYLIVSADVERYVPPTAFLYSKVKEIYLARGGEYKISFDLKVADTDGSATAYGRIYCNGVAKGTEQSTTSGTYVTKTENISGWSAGDLCQLYIKRSAWGNGYACIKNFRIYESAPITPMVVID